MVSGEVIVMVQIPRFKYPFTGSDDDTFDALCDETCREQIRFKMVCVVKKFELSTD